MPANFRTEEGMRRLLTAVIAAHDIRLNYKAVSKHYGSDWTESGIEHFFRPLKKNAACIRKMVERDEDAADFNHNAWQFRQIKRDAEAMKQGKGAGAPDSTPAVTPKSNRKRPATSAPSTGRSTASKKARGSAAKSTEKNTFINLDDDESDHSPIQTPTKIRRSIVNFDMERETYARMGVDYDTGAPLATAAPSLDMTKSESPNNDEDIKPVTPGDAPSHSFAQATQPPAGGDSFGMWGNNSFGVGNVQFLDFSDPQKSYAANEVDDDELSV